MSQRLASLLIYSIGLGKAVRGVNGVETAFHVLSPPSLFRPNGYRHQSAEFGFTKCPLGYQTQTCQFTANLIHLNNLLCDNDSLEDVAMPSGPFVILVDGGDCSFVTQARNAQSLEAAGLIIADRTCLCSEKDFRTSDFPCVNEPPLLVDDGMGDNVAIPSILLQKQDADAIKSALLEEQVKVEFMWESNPNRADTVTVEYWHVPSPYHNTGQDLSSSFGMVLEHMESVSFTPKFYIIPGAEIGCHPDNPTEDPSICLQRCANYGRYCAKDSAEEGVSGAKIVEEMVRRLCIWEWYGQSETDSIGSQYWQYVTAFEEKCLTDDGPNELWQDGTCSREVMDEAEMDYMRVSRCVIQSGGTTGDRPNEYLEASLADQQGIVGLDPPSIVVNGVQYQSETFSQAFDAICASHNTNSLSDACVTCVNCANDFSCVVEGEACLEPEIFASPPTISPTLAAPVFVQPSPDNQGVLPTEESNEGQPAVPTIPTRNPHALQPTEEADNQITPVSTSVDQDSEISLMNTNATVEADEDDGDDEDGGGLSDNTKVVIVVAVVGGAILVIFFFVIYLVVKLLKRIRKLEKKEKQTPTTTSPAGSNIWDPPQYVGKEDPFNSECEPIPPELLEEMGIGPVANNTTTLEPSAIGAVTAVTAQQNSPLSSVPTTEPNRGVLVTDPESQASPQEKSTILAGQVDTKSLLSGDTLDVGKQSNTDSIQPEKTKPNKKTETTTNKPKSKRSTKNDSAWVDIMGKAAPEAKIPRSFSWEDEEKEEVMNDWKD